MRIGFAGAGNMAGAMARGWAGAERRPEATLFCDIDVERAEALAAEVGGETRASLAELAQDCDVLLLAVKPTALDDVARELEGKAPPIVSVLGGTPVARIAEAFPGVPVLRLMPNQPVEVRRGVICHVRPQGMAPDLEAEVLTLLRELGLLVELEEQHMEAAMAIMSCSPAYIALIAESLVEAGEREGLDRSLAGEVVAEALAGTAELLRVREHEAIRRAVAPPGGATDAGLAELERGGLKATLDAAVRASLERFR